MTPVEHARGDTSIRAVTRADLLDVLHIEKSVFPQPWPYSAFERYVDAPGFLVSVTDADDALDSPDETLDSSDGLQRRPAADAADHATTGNGDSGGGLAAALDSVTGDGETITGYVVATERSDDGGPVGHVKNIAVHPDCQHEGVGSALLARALSVLSNRDVRGVKLEVRRGNDPAIGLYRSFGFEHHRTIPEYYADGEDALLFVLDFADRDAF
ncbi:GNAT family N-acetyltransferase [Halobacterium zhouii]|uniref:GNAT family N-acetyltransferase n=1 Tax=Halobacterium zhouii TaxID=2902624 RepID=UPI001E2F9F5D|nr:GNAT family N-acetyltransferase [Halobacterium zhouii]